MLIKPKGTKDVLPNDSYKWQYIEKTARELAIVYGFKEIRTPVFEHTEVFLRGIGNTTDVVNKEMYTFKDKGDRSVTLKPEGTAGVARSFIENGMQSDALPKKLFYITPCFRYENPQAGRLREFHQFGVEVLGSSTPDTDAEVILFVKTLFDKLGIHSLELNINSIGCKECRKTYNDALKDYLRPHLDEMCDTCRERFDKNPLRILDCKEEKCKAICKDAPRMLDYLCDDCKSHFEKVKTLLDSCGVEYKIDPNIVRGLDYYTKTVFEFVSTSIGAQSTVCGGGRYDGLIEEMGGGKVQGVGFALGIERLLLLMDSTGVTLPDDSVTDVYIAPMGEEQYPVALKTAQTLREKGVKTELDHMQRSIKAQFKYADKIGAKNVVVIGSGEIESGKVKVKRMSDGVQTEVKLDELTDYFD